MSPAEAIDRRASRLQTVSPENDDDYPVPQVRPTHAPLQPTSFGGMRAKPKWTAARKLTPGDDDDSAGALLQVASPPMGAKTNYVGPALLCLRLGLNRSGSAKNCWDGNKNSEGPRSELAVRNGNGLAYVKIVSSRF